ncbi:MAG: hypothetical protein M3527_03870, partial [Actinomycetota bacterium]|nr:hypothetical protein [Actinomycetota bacterium]
MLRTPWPSLALVAVALAVAVVAYPVFDERRSTGGGSDADDAVLVVLDNLEAGVHDPYETDTYLGNPPASGPGSLVW